MSGFHVDPDHLDRSGGKLGDFAEKVSSGGERLQQAGQNLLSHASGDRSGVGAVVSKVFGRGLEITGKVFSEGGRVVGAAGGRLKQSGRLYRESDEHAHSLLNRHNPKGAPTGRRPGGGNKQPRSVGGRGQGRRNRSARRTAGGDARRAGQSERSGCTNGDPINMRTGEVVLPQTDVGLPAILPLVLTRRHLSGYRLGQSFGPTWASTVDQRLEVDEEGVCFVADDGRVLIYPPVTGDGVLPVEGERWPLHRDEHGDYVLSQPDMDRTLHFGHGDDVLPIDAVVSLYGQRIDFRYDDSGTLVGIDHSGGYRLTVLTEHERVTGLRLGETVLVDFGYDEDGRLTEVINSSHRPQVFEYDDAGRMARWVDRNGEWYRFHYDGRGRCHRAEGSGDALAGLLEIDDDRRISVWTNSLGHRTTFEFNELDQIVRQVDPLGNATLSEWDRYDRLLARTDPLGRTTRYTYDDRGNLTAVTRPDGTQDRTEYDDRDRPVVLVDPDGAVWRRWYDDRGNLAEVVDPAGATTRYGYDERNHLSSITDPLGGVYRVTTDDAGLPTETVDPLTVTVRYERDAFGRISAITNPLGDVTHYGWSIEGKLLWRTTADGSTERWGYDGEGNQIDEVDVLGRSVLVESTHFDLPSAITEVDGTRVEYRYDSELRLTAVVNQQRRTWRYDYDPAGRLIRETDFDGRETGYGYDAAGQLVSKVDAMGQTTEFRHDSLGNLVERRSSDGMVARFEYDEVGRLSRAVNADADVRFERDALGRVVAETSNGNTVSCRYDALGRMIQRRTPSGAESAWSYDAVGRPAALRAAGHVLAFGYDVAGREVLRSVDGGRLLAQAWDSNHRLVGQSVAGLPQPRRFHYRRDDFVTTVDDPLRGTRQYSLDPLGRVTAVTGQGWQESYRYDQTGSLVPAGNTRHSFDRLGRLVLRQRKLPSSKPQNWHYAWNADNQLVEVVTPDGSRWRYRYDALGRRVSKQRLTPNGSAVAEQVEFTWDDTVLVEQVHSGGRATTWDWTPDGERPVGQTERTRDPQGWVDEQFYGIVTDIVGTPTELVDVQGNLAWESTQTLWGEPLAPHPGRAYTPLRFPGQYHDTESGLNYNHHRYYVPELASYASADPLGLMPSPNPRAYVPNPLTWSDPLGLAACKDCGKKPEELPKGDNRWFNNRKEAFNAARDRAGIPRTQQPTRQWTVGDDPTQKGRANYHHDPAPGSHGRYYEYQTPNGPRVIAEHTNDPTAPHGHFHAYQPKKDHTGITVGEKYDRVDGPHHYYYGRHDPKWPKKH
ncbi:DUF6531 domain-containing protein [Kutzneria chonburiensis]|uniref:DUF6531 domain-containing protein n=1 Tax=Kutzneria chonburiensis TaxID=1483604 RepID=A0ABV6N8R5_9PSEU|nr:DUF6531 domain-containing protein [Kutzneria chonburiensis]